MLKILINSYEIDFDGSISFRMKNPIFSDEISHSLNIKTVNTPKNKDIIGQLHLPETRYNQVRFESMIVTDAFSFRGAIYFNSVTDKFLDFQFNSQNDFWNLADVSLRSLDIPFEAEYLPVKNSEFSNNFQLTGEYSGYINAIDEYGEPINDGTTAPVPFLRLNHIISGIFNAFNLRSKFNSLTLHPDIEQIFLYNNNSNVKYKYKKWTGIRTEPDEWFTYFDFFWVTIDNGAYKFNKPSGHTVKDGSYVLVVFSNLRPIEAGNQLLNNVFKAIVEDENNISFEGVEPVVSSLQGGAQDNLIYVAKPIYDGIYEEKIKNHLPEINAGNFLKEVEKITALRIFVDESAKEFRIMFLKDIIKSNEVTDITDFAGQISEQSFSKKDGFELSYKDPSEDEVWSERIKQLTELLTVKDPVETINLLPLRGSSNNDIRLVTIKNAYYRYYEINFLKKAGWEFYSDNVLSMKSGSGELNIQTRFSPLLCPLDQRVIYGENTISSFFCLIPTLGKEGKYILTNEFDGEDFRLFFYRGKFNHQVEIWESTEYGQGSLTYRTISIPLCNHDVFDSNGDKIPGANLSLCWDGEYGLYNQLYKEFIDLMVNLYREETRFINWPLWMLNSFPWWRKFRINHMNYLVKSIDLEMTNRGTTFKDTVLVPV